MSQKDTTPTSTMTLDDLRECKYQGEMQRKDVAAPPIGFRPAIPTLVKLDAVIRQDGRCKACGERLGQLKDTQFDHVPALQLRAWDPEEKNTIPPANDPGHIEAKHVNCHLAKTTGRKGESKKGDRSNGDIQRINKLRRLTEQETDFRKRLMGLSESEDPEPRQAKKTNWPKRPFPKAKGKRPNKDGVV